MTTADPRTKSSPPPIVAIVQYAGQLDHFAGVDAALAARSVRAIRLSEWELADLDRSDVELVAVKDCESPLSLAAIRWARRRGVPTLLLMDGVVEYRNTFVNPDAPELFLRPAPVDVVACAGETDREKLWSWGNVAVATGLPRIAAAFPKPIPLPAAGAGKLLIATAKRPAFDVAERERLIEALYAVREATERSAWRGRVKWRLTVGLEDEVGVENDSRLLRECLAECSAVLTTPSTLLLEAMAAGRACGVLHPQEGPLWQEAVGEWRGTGTSATDELFTMLGRLESPSPEDWRRQERAQARINAGGFAGARSPAHGVADAIVSLVRGQIGGGPGRKRELPRVERIRLGANAEKPREPGVRRVVSCVSCDSTPIGGVMTWSLRMTHEFGQRRRELGYEFRTLVVAMQPDGWRSEEFDPTAEPGVDLCVIDPMADHHERVETIRRALEALSPDIVLPNYNDACFMAAALLKPRGVRTVAIAHADDGYYRNLAATYDTWSAAIGVSSACVRWLAPLADGRTVEQVVYGVPVATQLAPLPTMNSSSDHLNPLKLAYIGRMVEEQKRISDLLVLLDELEARSVPCELHMVGDGPDLGAWRARFAQREYQHVRATVHGRRSPTWVEQFLPTMDACVLVSGYEGTSVVMLEAMGQGVVPVVTNVRSGVGEWVRDGDNGVVVAIGDMPAMAAKLAALNANRADLASMRARAWQTIRDSGLSICATAKAYARVFVTAVSRPIDPRPTDTGLRPMDLWRWNKGEAEHAAESDAWCERGLRKLGYREIAFDSPSPGCDAVLVRSSRVEPVAATEIAAWRDAGLGVAVSPHLRQDGLAARVLELVRSATRRGRTRIAVYPPGRHTRRIAQIFKAELRADSRSPFVGFIDDSARPGQLALGLPVVRPEDAVDQLAPDAVLLSSDTFEAKLWERTARLREEDIEVIPIYGCHDRQQINIVAATLEHQDAEGAVHAHRAR